jgi:hypothetical protein
VTAIETTVVIQSNYREQKSENENGSTDDSGEQKQLFDAVV